MPNTIVHPGAHGSPYLPQMAEVRQAEKMTELEKFFNLQFPDGRALGHQPGQFVEVSLFGIGEAPISVCSSPTDTEGFDLCVRASGSVTNALHRLEVGSQVGIRGPFGRGYPMPEMEGADILVVAGGIGLAPLRSVIRYVLAHRSKYGRLIILYGAKHPSELLFTDEIRSWEQREDVELQLTVDRPDDAWKGHVGVITTLFPRLSLQAAQTFAVVTGPPIMYRFVLLELLGKGIPLDQILFSLERRMKCGIGKCGHCQINGKYCCQDGPVFTFPELKVLWEASEAVAPV